MIVACECGAKLRIDDAKISDKGVKVRCPRCGKIQPVLKASSAASAPVFMTAQPSAYSSQGPLILIAHESDALKHMISDVLIDDGFRVDTASDSFEALKKAVENNPQGMVLDVGLPGGIYGFELCEELKGNPATRDIKIILLSSVHDRRRYKRKPSSLYGADDYIEKHHIPDSLTSKFRRLIVPEPFAPEAPSVETSHPPSPVTSRDVIASRGPERGEQDALSYPSSEALPKTGPVDAPQGTGSVAASMGFDGPDFQKEECDIQRAVEADPEAIEKARRFARLIIADIALYNQEAVSAGTRNGNVLDLLKKDFNEGRELYEQRVTEAVRNTMDCYQEAIDNFITATQRIKQSENREQAP